MSEKFKAIIIDNQNDKFTREIKEIDKSHLKDGNVLVKVDYSKMRLSDAPNQEEMEEADLDSASSDATTAVMGAMKFNRREKRKNTIDFD